MIPGWEIRLQEIAGNPNLTFIYFVGFVLIGALGVRFAVYALWNRRASQLPAQTSIWTYLGGVGATAADVATSRSSPLECPRYAGASCSRSSSCSR